MQVYEQSSKAFETNLIVLLGYLLTFLQHLLNQGGPDSSVFLGKPCKSIAENLRVAINVANDRLKGFPEVWLPEGVLAGLQAEIKWLQVCGWWLKTRRHQVKSLRVHICLGKVLHYKETLFTELTIHQKI